MRTASATTTTTEPGFLWIQPQDTARKLNRVEISSLMDDILKLFKDHPECEGALNSMLREIKNSAGFDAGSITDIVEAFRANGIAYMHDLTPHPGSTGGGDAGTAREGVPAIDIIPGGTPERTTIAALGEVIHWAGIRYDRMDRRFVSNLSDKILYTAQHKLGWIMSVDDYRRTYPEWAERDRQRAGYDYAESRLAHGGIDIKCLGIVNGYLPRYAKP